MKFLIENNYEILINKYNKSDVLVKKGFVFLLGKYKRHDLRLPPLPSTKITIPECQVAQAGNYIYIPNDQIELKSDTTLYSYPTPVERKIMQKYEWKEIKEKYPYKGV